MEDFQLPLPLDLPLPPPDYPIWWYDILLQCKVCGLEMGIFPDDSMGDPNLPVFCPACEEEGIKSDVWIVKEY